MVTSVSVCAAPAARAYMVVSCLKVNKRGSAAEVQWRSSRGAAGPGGVAVAAGLSYEISRARP